MTWALDGRPLAAVLLARLRYLGDVAMATALCGLLRRGDPGLRLGFLCETAYAPLLAGHPDLARVHALKVRRGSADARARGGARADGGGATGGGTVATIRALRRARYDLAVDLFFNPRSAWLLWLAGVPERIGGARGARRRLYTRTVGPLEPSAPAAVRALLPGGMGAHAGRLAPLRHVETGLPFLDWVAREGAAGAEAPRPRIARPAPGVGAAGAALAALGVAAGEGFVLLAPTATWPTKEWPAARWRELIAWLAPRAGRPLVVLTAPSAPARAAAAVEGWRPERGGLLSPLPLSEVLRVIDAASLVIGVDGGIVHAAVALERPTLALFGPTDPGLWFPYEHLGPYRVLATRPACHPCDRHECAEFVCLPRLEAAAVSGVALAMLADAEATG